MPRQKTKTKKDLNENDIAFCYEYVANKRNGTKAYLESHKTNNKTTAGIESHRLLKKPKILAKIEELTKRHIKTLGYNTESVLSEISKNAFSDVRDYVSWNPKDGVIIKDSKDLGEYASAIKKIKIEATEVKIDGEPTGIKDYKIELELHSKDKALEMLSKNLNLLDGSQVEKEDLKVHVTFDDNEDE
jgi:phage terminase small subunit